MLIRNISGKNYNKIFKNVGDDIDANSSYRDYSSRNSNLFDN